MTVTETIHASAVVTGERAVIIRGPSGAGKSRLARALLQAAQTGLLPYARLVADDRVKIMATHGRLVVSVPEAIRGMIEVHGLGIRASACEPLAVAGLVVDLAANDAARMPENMTARLLDISLPRLPIGATMEPLPIVLAALSTAPKG
ncbi:MAG TPA: HPr kinase/phosphatase C-terminal domain-containing protein [Xanthobacteraceae bacterium]|jgi:alpha-D-ribose 1-methylphosphonate 5-triphosphate synthase subunit PhnL|nr:HPr kinase/phosphatase C-terminal domain-containing protein [Xanthobacteraceae bacterium]